MLGLIESRDWLSIASDLAEFVTGAVAGTAGVIYFWRRCERRKAIERHLIKERQAAEAPGGKGSGARSIVHLMGRCSMTEAQVLEAAFANKNIKTWIAEDKETGRADTLMFRIEDKAWPKLKNSN